MFLIRRVEEESARGYAAGQDRRLPPPLHRSGGRGRRRDRRAPARRLRRHDLPRSRHRPRQGHDRRAPLMAELFGKATGCSQGPRRLDAHVRQGAQHARRLRHRRRAHPARGRASRSRRSTARDGRVTLCFFGEGAVSIGGFHEGVSLAALWKLPIVFICENNEYSMGTPLSRIDVASRTSRMKALGYGMDRDRFFADDVLEVEQRIGEAVKRAREHCAAHAGRGPHLPLPRPLDERSRRSTARSDELEEHKKRDPLSPRAREARRARHDGEARLKRSRTSVEAEVADAVKFADESPEPDAGRPRADHLRRAPSRVLSEPMARTIRYREALREAMIEEMERDDRVFLMGEEVGHYQGAYKVSEGMLEKFGDQARHRHAHRRGRLRRHRHRRGDGRARGPSSSS